MSIVSVRISDQDIVFEKTEEAIAKYLVQLGEFYNVWEKWLVVKIMPGLKLWFHLRRTSLPQLTIESLNIYKSEGINQLY